MSNQKYEAGREIAKRLLPSEDAIDGSIIQSAQLIISIVEGRRKARVAAEVGHDAFVSAVAGLAALKDARDHTINCHRKLADARDDLGLSPQAMGCTLGKLPKIAEAPLGIVEVA